MYMCRTIGQSTVALPGTTALEEADCLSPQLSVISSSSQSIADWLVLVQVLYRAAPLLCIHRCCVLHVQKTLFCSISFQCLALQTFLSPLLWWLEGKGCDIDVLFYSCFLHALVICYSLQSMCYLITMIICVVWWHCFDLVLRHHDFCHYHLVHSYYDY